MNKSRKTPKSILCGKCNVELSYKEMNNCQLFSIQGEFYKLKSSNGYLCALCYNDQLQKGEVKRSDDDIVWTD